MLLHAVLVLNLHAVLSLVLLLHLGEAEDDLVRPSGPALAPRLCGEVLGALRQVVEVSMGLHHISAYLEPCDLGDGIAQDVEDKEGIVSLCGGDFVCWLHIFWFLPFSGERCGGFVPVLRHATGNVQTSTE